MSIKFRRDGAVFPTEVKNGSLIVHLGQNKFEHPMKLLSEDFPYDNTYFPMSNIMAYLSNGETIVILRFDGTATKLTKDYKVIGFVKFDYHDIYEHVVYLPVGCTVSGPPGERVTMPCSVYSIPDGDSYVLECIGDPEPIVFNPMDNPIFSSEILHGTRYFPTLVNTGNNRYTEDSGKYDVKGLPLKITQSIEI